jgi:hypothetical protein
MCCQRDLARVDQQPKCGRVDWERLVVVVLTAIMSVVGADFYV